MQSTSDASKRNDAAPVGNQSRHILLLDDEKPVRDALSRLLKARGHRCTAAATGEALLETLKQGLATGVIYDLAILDIRINDGMDGIETMRQIRRIDDEIPVISMSGYPTETLFSGDEKNRFAAHLEKPFNADHLAAEIARVCL